MKKIAISLTAVTMLLTGITGCGDVNDNAANQQEGFTVNQGRQGGNYYGARGDGTGMQGAYNDMMGRETERYGQQGYARGWNNRNGAHGGRIGAQNRARGNRAGAYGTRAGAYGGFGRGIVGDDRAGMVDEDGILNRRPRAYQGQQTSRDRGRMGGNAFRGSNFLGDRDRGIPHEFGERGHRGLNRQGQHGERRHQGLGQQGQQGRQGPVTGYYDSDDGRAARELADRIEDQEGVQDCRVIVNGDDIVVGLETDGDDEQVSEEIRSKVSRAVDDKDVHVVTDQEHLRTIRGMDEQLRAGEPFEEVGATFDDMLQDLGRAVQRPFERSR
ncbi:YhcN/YlaJ family sporulation lipoprotein [Evansella halocellulosilytica]|uniref:YhcN/YlaJ family sporulation lipoprotein n=1 Tax=Evansella halocellulosilytica TaxID=2011013 RepID=UPI000BB7695F|nr:YhcN/YlaJ family sporulation lipoprotein [Evansella halocellulosilytica]